MRLRPALIPLTTRTGSSLQTTRRGSAWIPVPITELRLLFSVLNKYGRFNSIYVGDAEFAARIHITGGVGSQIQGRTGQHSRKRTIYVQHSRPEPVLQSTNHYLARRKRRAPPVRVWRNSCSPCRDLWQISTVVAVRKKTRPFLADDFPHITGTAQLTNSSLEHTSSGAFAGGA